MKIHFKTSDHIYYLTLKLYPFRNGKLFQTYCGATVSALNPRPGETWTRGNDLRDGKFRNMFSVLWDMWAHAHSIGRWTHKTECQIKSHI